jgi:lipopolysaccharide export system protein LptA
MKLLFRTPDRKIARNACAAALLLAAVSLVAAHAQGGGPANAMQGFSQNRDQPIQIEAASLEVRDKKKEAVFSGNVKVIQGDTTMTSKTLVVFYDQSGSSAEQPAPAPKQKGAKAAPGAPIQSAAPGPTGSSSIKRLEARSNVVVTQKDQVVTGELAVFDTKANQITISGGVVMTQCKNVMRGDRLTVDMTTGMSRVESDGSKGVQVLFQQGGSNEGCGSSAKPGGPGAAPAPAGPPTSLFPGKQK